MSIVKTARSISRRVGRLLDEEDRTFISQALVLVLSVVLLATSAGGAVGLAWRVFELARG